MAAERYSFAVTNLGHFIRRIAIDAVRWGYYRYAIRYIPEDKDPMLVDTKLIETYEITQDRAKRTRRKSAGLANVVFVRYHHTIVLLATEGRHPAFDRIRSHDARTSPIHTHGYSIGVIGGKPCVQVSRRVWKPITDRILADARSPKARVENQLNSLYFYSFPGVIRQKLRLAQQINKIRKKAMLTPVELRFTQKIEARFKKRSRMARRRKG